MKELLLEIKPDILHSFPNVRVSGFLVDGLDRASESLTDSAERLEAARAKLLNHGPTNLPSDPRIIAWRDAFKRSGLKPSTFKSSPEQLAQRMLKGASITTPLPVVNAYCAISANHLAPIGGYDLDRLPQMQVSLRLSDPGSDRFIPLGGRSENMPLLPTIAVYASGNEIICWSFNHRDSANTCLQADTRFAVFLGEGVSVVHYDPLRNALEELRALLESSGARVSDCCLIDRESTLARLSV